MTKWYINLVCQIGKHVLYILVLLDFVDEFLYRLAFLVGQGLGVVGDTYKLAGLYLKSVLLQVLLHAAVLVKIAVDDNGVFLFVHA